MTKDVKKAWRCPYNDWIRCTSREKPCEECGWNPVVAYKRFNRFCNKHHITFDSNLLSTPKEKEEDE